MSGARLGLLLALVALSLALGLVAGTVPLGPGEVWRGLWSADAPASVIVRELRVPRVLLAFLVGGTLIVEQVFALPAIRWPSPTCWVSRVAPGWAP